MVSFGIQGGMILDNNTIESTAYLQSLAKDVLREYNIFAGDIAVIQSGSIKTVWKIKFNNSLLCLKRLRQSLEKASFSVQAQIYVKNAGGNVPQVILTPKKEAILQYNNQLFVLYEWLEGRELNFNNSSDLCYAIKGLAAFHLTSKGYKPLEACKISSKANKLPSQYESMSKKLMLWKEESITKPNSSPHASYLRVVDSMLNLGRKAQTLIVSSSYNDLTNNSNCQVLCHQDYGTGNALLGKSGVLIIDLDGVTLDLPSRDLRKLIFKYEEPYGKWQSRILSDILDWYTEIYPVTNEEKRVLYIDLLFPHRFYGLVKNLFINSKSIKASEIEKIAVFEQSKLQLLEELLEMR